MCSMCRIMVCCTVCCGIVMYGIALLRVMGWCGCVLCCVVVYGIAMCCMFWHLLVLYDCMRILQFVLYVLVLNCVVLYVGIL